MAYLDKNRVREGACGTAVIDWQNFFFNVIANYRTFCECVCRGISQIVD
jgi:hypothetical protein